MNNLPFSSPQSQTQSRPAIVLVVDDEQSIVNAVRRELCSSPAGRQRFQVEGFTSPIQALERAKEQPFDLVISDYRMPGMDGLTFLKTLGEIQPDCSRVVLSGQTDFDSLTRMVNETHIYRFIPKPWSEYFLKSSISQALRFRQTMLENRRLADIVRQHGFTAHPILNEEERILVVDDDTNVLNALTRDLSRRSDLDELFSAVRTEIAHQQPARLEEKKLTVQICSSALQALKLAGSTAFSCVIADYQMPDIDGISLLQAFEEKQPDCIRILLSGVASTETLVNAIDLAHIYAYTSKPWVDFELKATVAEALEHRRMLLENRVLAEMLRTHSTDSSSQS